MTKDVEPIIPFEKEFNNFNAMKYKFIKNVI